MKFATADIETNRWIKFLMLGFFDGSEYKIFSKVNDFLDYITKKEYSGLVIYFHNGGRFDFLFLIEEIMNRGKVRFIEKSTGLLSIRFQYKNINLEFRDSFAILPSSLEKLIETFNIKEKKIKIDFKINHKFSDKLLQEHLKNDCISLYRILEQVKEKEKYLSLTIASHSFRKFREDFFYGNIWNVNKCFDFYFRKNFYKGGRVEVFRGYRNKTLYYYDINSLYPFVMLNNMPAGSPYKTKSYRKNKIGYYKVELKEDTHFYVSPLSIQTAKGNYYVNGKTGDEFYLMSNELQYLMDNKIKFKIISGYYFKEQGKLFSKYVLHYYRQKQDAKDEVNRYLAKCMLNHLYGKFGQKLLGENLEIFDSKIHNINSVKVLHPANDLILVTRDRHLKYKGVYIASYITALARMELLKWLDLAGQQNIFYCDTDSIITTKKLPVSEKIGELKLVAKIKEGIFIAPKTYGYKTIDNIEVVHFKGFHNDSFKLNDLRNLINEKVKFLVQEKEAMLGFRSALKRKNGIILDKGKFLKLVNEKKELVNEYDRRKKVFDKNYKFVTYPFTKNEVEK